MPLPLHRRPKPQQLLRNLLPRRPQHIDQPPRQPLVQLREQRHRQPLRARPPRPSDPVHVVFHRQRECDIDDRFHGRDVETARRDVGGDEEGTGAAFESGESGAAEGLRHVAVDGGDGHPVLVEEVGDARGFFLVEAEDEDAVVLVGRGALVLAQELEQACLFFSRVDDVHDLRDFGVGAEFARGVVGADGDVHGVLREGGCEVANAGGPGGGEHEGLPARWGSGADYFADFFFEAFVQHAVCFVEDDVVDVAEVGGAFVYEVVQSAGGGDDYVGCFKSLALRVFGYAAVDADGGEAGGGGEGFDLSVDLYG